MSNDINYQKELEKLLAVEENRGKRLFLHSCCAPCSSYCLTYLSSFFDITVYYYNPNITEDKEYLHRVEEQKRLIKTLNEEGVSAYPIKIVEGDHDVASFFQISKGFENEPEGGARCARCFRLRLESTAKKALEYGADYFATTLTISPLKNAKMINSIGMELSGKYEISWLPSDFKKREGYKQSIELSKKYDLYRQDYCGCEYSKRTSE